MLICFLTFTIMTSNDFTKVLTSDNDTYIVPVQGYRYLAAENCPEIVLKTYIEVLKLPAEREVKTSGEGAELVGYLYKTHDLANSNPDFRNVPKFIPFDDEFYDEKRATYFGDKGLQFAKQELEKLSEVRLVQGIKRYLIKDYDRNIILNLRLYDGKEWLILAKIELKAFKAPEIYKGNNYVFRLILTADEDETTTASYTLLGKYPR